VLFVITIIQKFIFDKRILLEKKPKIYSHHMKKIFETGERMSTFLLKKKFFSVLIFSQCMRLFDDKLFFMNTQKKVNGAIANP